MIRIFWDEIKLSVTGYRRRRKQEANFTPDQAVFAASIDVKIADIEEAIERLEALAERASSEADDLHCRANAASGAKIAAQASARQRRAELLALISVRDTIGTT